MKNILISGGAGFIGSHLSKKLIEEGNRIFCLDNLYTGNLININQIIDDPNFKFIKHDIGVKFEAILRLMRYIILPVQQAQITTKQNQ